MRATTVRFDAEAWEKLEDRAERLGIAKAKYIHDAAIARLAGAEAVERLTISVIDRLVRERVVAMIDRLVGERVAALLSDRLLRGGRR